MFGQTLSCFSWTNIAGRASSPGFPRIISALRDSCGVTRSTIGMPFVRPVMDGASTGYAHFSDHVDVIRLDHFRGSSLQPRGTFPQVLRRPSPGNGCLVRAPLYWRQCKKS